MPLYRDYSKGDVIKQQIRDKKAYDLARKFLLNFKYEGVTNKIIDKYLHFTENRHKPSTLGEIYKRLLETAQGANMMPGVISGAIGGIDNLGKILFKFNPSLVVKRYGHDWEKLLDDIENKVAPHGKVRRKKRSIWPKYCKTILSGAHFINQFSSINDFYKWVDSFYNDEKSRAALPIIISYEIEGIGFALACDFLKELGYINYAKPDIHVKEIFKGLNLCAQKANDYSVYQAILRVARNAKKSPYDVDKLFWLIGSGKFYDDKQIGKNGKIGRHKKEFIKFAEKYL